MKFKKAQRGSGRKGGNEKMEKKRKRCWMEESTKRTELNWTQFINFLTFRCVAGFLF